MDRRRNTVSLLLAAAFALVSCSTGSSPDGHQDLSKQEPCAASWNLRYEQLVGHHCYPKRVVEAARAGCESGDKTSCKVSRAVGRFNRTTHLDLEAGALSMATAAGCEAGVADGCALHGLDLLRRGGAAEAAEIFKRGCELGSRASCYEAARLGDQVVPQTSSSPSRICESKEPVPCRENACRRADGASCRALGRFAESGEHLERNLGDAFDYYERACMLGDLPGCGELGRFYAGGQVVPRRAEVARQLFVWGCGAESTESTEACLGAARMIAKGIGGGRDHERAQKLYATACDRESRTACRELAALYQTSRALESSKGDIAVLFDKACVLGDGEACARRADVELERKPLGSEDIARIETLYHKSCDAGFMDGCRKGADLFTYGRGVPADAKLGAELSAKACETGSSSHCWRAADAYRFGYGVDIDGARATGLIKRAIDLYKKECERSDRDGCVNAAHAIAHGFPDAKRLDEARKYLETACKGGAKSACREIGQQYVAGELYPRDRRRGIQKLRSLCNDGDQASCSKMADELSFGIGGDVELHDAHDQHQRSCLWFQDERACVQLGLHYQRGHGTRRDVNKAYELASRACSKEDNKVSGCTGAALAIMRREPRKEVEKTVLEILQELCVFEGEDSVCTPLGRMYESGYGVPKEPYRAISLYERVCDAKEGLRAEACSRAALARLAQKADKEANQTNEKLDKACADGDAKSCIMLARRYEFGSFDGDRFRKALPYYRKACKRGNPEACTLYVGLMFEEGTPWGDKFSSDIGWACQKGTAQMCSEWGAYMGTHNWDVAVRMTQSACEKGNEPACRFLKSNLEPLPKGAKEAQADAE